MIIKELIFQSNIALDEWVKRNAPFVRIMSIGAPSVDFGYDVSIRLLEPNIVVRYIEFPKDFRP